MAFDEKFDTKYAGFSQRKDQEIIAFFIVEWNCVELRDMLTFFSGLNSLGMAFNSQKER